MSVRRDRRHGPPDPCRGWTTVGGTSPCPTVARAHHGDAEHGPRGVLALGLRPGRARAPGGHRTGPGRTVTWHRAQGARLHGLHDLTAPLGSSQPAHRRGWSARCQYTDLFVCEPPPPPKRATRSVCRSRSTKRRSTRLSRRWSGRLARDGPGARLPARQSPTPGHRGPDGWRRRPSGRSDPRGAARLLRPGGERHRGRSHRPAGDRHHLR